MTCFMPGPHGRRSGSPARKGGVVHLPRGRWELLWTGEAYGDERSGGWATVPAPLGSPALLGSEVGASISARLRGI